MSAAAVNSKQQLHRRTVIMIWRTAKHAVTLKPLIWVEILFFSNAELNMKLLYKMCMWLPIICMTKAMLSMPWGEYYWGEKKTCHWAVCKTTIMFTSLKPIYIMIFYQVCSEPKENPPKQQQFSQNNKYASKPIHNTYNTQIMSAHISPLSKLTTWKHRHKQFIQQTLHMGGSSSKIAQSQESINKQSNTSASSLTAQNINSQCAD